MKEKKTLTKTVIKLKDEVAAPDKKTPVLSKVISTKDKSGSGNGVLHREPTIEESSVPIGEIAARFISLFGNEVFEHIRDNPYLRLSSPEEYHSLEEWLVFVLKTIFAYDDLQHIGRQLQHFSSDRSDVEKMRFEKEKQELQEKYDALRSEKNKLEMKLKGSIVLTDYIRNCIEHTRSTERLRQVLDEAIESPSDNLAPFVIAFCNGWVLFNDILSSAPEAGSDEEPFMSEVSRGLKKLLSKISEKYISQRRAVLQEVAKIASSKFDTFEFISPEDTLQVDPRIHNAAGIGGTTVMEGISFAVIRKDTRQTVRYAEVRVR